MKKTILILSSVFFLQHAHAGGFKVALQGTKQAGMGSIGIGFLQDAATIYYNPAGMSFIENQANGGINFLFPSVSFLDKNTNQITHATSQMFNPFSLYATGSLAKGVKVGLGVYTPFGTGIMYPTDWTGRYILHQIQLSTVFIQPTLSLKLSNQFSIGAGLVIAKGQMLLEKDIPLTSASNSDVANAQLKGKAGGVGFNLGAYIKASDKVNLGITYHSKVVMSVKDGDAVFANVPTAASSSFPTANKFSTELPLPSELGLGASFKLSPGLHLAIDLNYTYWKSYDSLGFDYKTNTPALTDAKSARLYENALCIRAGVNAKISKHTQFRVGAFYDNTPVKDAYVTPELPDNNKVGLSAGFTFKVAEKLNLDLSLLYENVEKRLTKNKETQLEGTFQTKVLAPGIGLSYLFTKNINKRKNY